MAGVLLSGRGLSKRYQMGDVQVVALRDVDFDLHEREMVVLLGPSGSGKSTLLNILGGLDTPTSGTVRYRDDDLSHATEADLTRYRREHVGFVFQFYNLILTLNAAENVELPMLFSKVPRAEREERSRELLGDVGLGMRVDHMPEELSGGEQQRVAVARALSNNPSVILGDEPTGDLDSKSAKHLMDIVWELRREKKVTFVLVTHDPLVVSKCDRVFSIRDGKILREIVPKQKEKLVSDEERLSMDTLY